MSQRQPFAGSGRRPYVRSSFSALLRNSAASVVAAIEVLNPDRVVWPKAGLVDLLYRHRSGRHAQAVRSSSNPANQRSNDAP